MLRSGTTAERSAAFEAMPLSPDGRVVPFLLEWLETSGSAQDYFLSHAIGEIIAERSDSSVPASAVMRALEQGHLAPEQAARALHRIGDTSLLIEELAHPEPVVKQTAGTALAAIQSDNPSLDIVGWISDGRLEPTRELIGNLNSPDRIRLLADEKPVTRRVAVEVIADKRDVAATPAVLERFADPDLERCPDLPHEVYQWPADLRLEVMMRDEVMGEDFADEVINVRQARKTALWTYAVLQRYMARCDIVIYDLCLFITSDGRKVYGEIDQDCGRYRHLDHGMLDKDVWRSGGSVGDVLAKWQLLAEMLEAPRNPE
jgi:hypothetical protein